MRVGDCPGWWQVAGGVLVHAAGRLWIHLSMSLLSHPTARDCLPPRRTGVGNSPAWRRRHRVVRDRPVVATTARTRRIWGRRVVVRSPG